MLSYLRQTFILTGIACLIYCHHQPIDSDLLSAQIYCLKSNTGDISENGGNYNGSGNVNIRTMSLIIDKKQYCTSAAFNNAMVAI